MSIIDIISEGAQTYADIQKIKQDYAYESKGLMTSMAGNLGQDTLAVRYGNNIDGYANLIAFNWNAHDWTRYLDITAGGTEGDAIEGTIIILQAGFDMMSQMVMQIQALVQETAGEFGMEVGGETIFGGSGKKVLRGRDARSAANKLRSKYGGGFARPGGAFAAPHTYRDWGGPASERPKTMEEFYRKLNSPGLPGLRARFYAGGTDAQLNLFFDANNQFRAPTTYISNGRRITTIPSSRVWAAHGYTNWRAQNDPTGSIYRDAMAFWEANVRAKEAAYKRPVWTGNAIDRNAPEPAWRIGYNPYTMARQFEAGKFAGPKTWEGRAAPFGTFGPP